MNYVHFTNALDLGGTAKTLQIFCQELQKRGHTVTVFCREDGPRGELLRNTGIPVNLVTNWESFVVAGKEADAVHIHISGNKDDQLAEALEQIKGRAKIIVTNVFGGYDKRLHDATDRQLFVSKTLLLKFFLQHPELKNDPRYDVLYNPIDITTLNHHKSDKKLLDVPISTTVLGRIARPDILKWDPVIELVIKKLVAAHKEFLFVFMSAPASVEKRLSKSKYAKYCHFLHPSRDESDVVLFYQSIDILLHSSSIGETFGCTIAEAMALGVPIVVRSTPFTKDKLYRDNAQVELVDQGEIGYISDSAQGLTDAVISLIESPTTRETFGEHGVRKVAETYKSGTLTDLLLQIYSGNKTGLMTTEDDREVYAKNYETRVKNATDPSAKNHLTDKLYTLYRTIQNRLTPQ